MIQQRGDDEVACLRAAGRINAQVHAEVRAALRPGLSTGELDAVAATALERLGGQASFPGEFGFPGTICVSVNEEVGHGVPGARVIGEGDLVTIDLGVAWEGYHTDAARTYVVTRMNAEQTLVHAREPGGHRHPHGNPSDRADLVTATQAALEHGIAMAQAGRRVSDISHAIQGTAQRAGFQVMRHAFGHGIGRQLHEDPQLANFGPQGLGPRLRPGMVLAIEPILTRGVPYVRRLENGWTDVSMDGGDSAHVEETVLITAGDAEILTRMEPEIATATEHPSAQGALQLAPPAVRWHQATVQEHALVLRLARDNMNAVLFDAWGRGVDPAEMFAGENAVARILESDLGDVIGCVITSTRRRALHVNVLVIDVPFQGQGWGKRVMQQVEQWTLGQGLTVVELWVQTNNARAVGFYRGLGFVPCGTPYIRTIAMRKVL